MLALRVGGLVQFLREGAREAERTVSVEYQPSRMPRIIIGTMLAGLAGFLLILLPISTSWGSIEKYAFERAFDRCSTKHGLETIEWNWIPAFDASINEIVIDTPAELAMMDCLNLWAGFVIDSDESVSRKSTMGEAAVLRTIESGSQFAPPIVHFSVEFTEFSLPD